jgi:hypothetical protein
MRARPAQARIVLEVMLVALVSVPFIWAFHSLFSEEPHILAERLALLYWPSWIVVNGFFGGIHGAPGWTLMPSVVIAVMGQNLLLWLVVKSVLRRAQKPREP